MAQLGHLPAARRLLMPPAAAAGPTTLPHSTCVERHIQTDASIMALERAVTKAMPAGDEDPPSQRDRGRAANHRSPLRLQGL